MDKFQTLHEKGNLGVNVYPNIQPSNIPSNAIDTTKLADSAVTTAKVADGAITTAKIADGAITTAKLALLSVDTGNIVNSAVTASKIATNAVTTAKIASNAVTTAKIADGAITTPKINRTIVNLTDYLNSASVSTFAQAQNVIATLLRDRIAIDILYSDDDLVSTIHMATISVDATYIHVYQLKSGGWGEVATISSDAELTTFMAGLGKEIYLKVMN